MNPLLYKYPLDTTASDINNKTEREHFNLASQINYPYKVLVLAHGYFYTDTVHIVDSKDNLLIPNVDYQCIYFNPEVTELTGLNACAAIVVKKKDVDLDLYVTAQLVGGKFCNVSYAIAQVAQTLLNNTRKPHWNNIIGIQDSFRPNGHLHALWQLYGFTQRVVTLKRITKALGDNVNRDMDGLFLTFKQELDRVGDSLDVIEARLTTHIQDTQTNPHRVNKIQVGLDNVVNSSTANETQARATHGNYMDIYATPWSLAISVQVNFKTKFDTHVNDFNNPHQVTAAQLNSYSISEFNTELNKKLTRGKTAEISTLLYGKTPQQVANEMRTNIPLSEIKSGRVSPDRFSNSTNSNYPGREFLLTPDLIWTPISEIIDRELKKSPQIFYANVAVSDPTNAIAVFNSIYSDNTRYPNGSLGIAAYISSANIYSGNGGVTSYYRHTFMLRKTNGVWTANGGPNA